MNPPRITPELRETVLAKLDAYAGRYFIDGQQPEQVSRKVRLDVDAVYLFVRCGVTDVLTAPLRMLAWCGVTELDLLLAAFELPWCDPALGGHRELAAGRPVLRDWADAVLLATMSAEPRPGQDEDGAWASYLHHVRGMPSQVRALVVASRYADVAAGDHQPAEAARRFARLVAGLDVLAADLPALRERAAVPPMRLPPVPPGPLRQPAARVRDDGTW